MGDEPSGLAFGVALGEVVAARIAVELAGGEDPCPEFRSWWARGWALRGRKPLWGLGFEGL